jgi:hypothetical protein
MQDIRLVDSDGEYLNLETQGGEKFRLVLDDSLRSAVKRETQVQLDSVSISPREIQDEVRAGSSADEVATRHSVPIEYVEKFALTVVDEIGHIIASAQAVRISVEADRYSEATQMEFAEVLEARLRNMEAKSTSWSATKHEGSPWMVSVTYESPQGNSSAVWSFDQRKLVLSPENEAAVKLSAGDFAATMTTPKLRQVDSATDSTKIIELPLVEVEPERNSDESPAAATALAPVSSIEELTKTSLEAIQETSATAEQEVLSPTADLLDALRKKRAAATSTEVSSIDGEIAPKIALPESDTETSSTKTQDSALTAEEVEATPVAPAAKKGRPSMPSWDEIVFGTKTDD